jgi:uncharacterized surface protein with fasciclin (FAS1) repeats
VEALRSPGPFTVFAPTNEAFDKLPARTIEALLKDKKINFHSKIACIPGKLMISEFKMQKSLETLQGQK